MEKFEEYSFNAKMETAMKEVRKILDTERHPVVAADIHHAYQDKYCLAEWLTNTGLAAVINCLEEAGLDQEKLDVLIGWAKEGHTVWLEASDGTQNCKFLRMEKREEASKEKVKGEVGILGKFSHQVVTTIKEYFYEISVDYKIVAKCNGKNPLVLNSRQGKTEVITTSDAAPLDKMTKIPLSTKTLDISFLLKEVASGRLAFNINRKEKCQTPLQNAEVEKSLEFFNDLKLFAKAIFEKLYSLERNWASLQSNTNKEQPKNRLSSHATTENIFLPIIPLFEEGQIHKNETQEETMIACLSKEDSALTLGLKDTNQFLAHQKTSLKTKLEAMNSNFKDGAKELGLISNWEAKLVVCSRHLSDLCHQYEQSMYYIEHMMNQQLTKAIGKSVTPQDFEKFMRFHEKRIFAPDFLPQPFSYAVRRPEHHPEGVLSLEDTQTDQPVYTMRRKIQGKEATPMTFKINAATDVTFNGDRFLHAFVANIFGHKEDRKSPMNINLVAHTRQFSCFMLLLGRIGPGQTFEPKHAILLKNKDDLKIPILLETLPTPKEFKDAIESLSPEQQRFAKAYRSMQLEGTVFGMLTIQLKPQLEKLLKIPEDSLTKEIQLTQDLLKLFIDYQIPSDLLSYDGEVDTDLATKLGKVKDHVKNIMKMLEDTKKEELDEAAKKFAQDRLESDSEEECAYGMMDDQDFMDDSYSSPVQDTLECAGAKRHSLSLKSFSLGRRSMKPKSLMVTNECAMEMAKMELTTKHSSAPSKQKYRQVGKNENAKPFHFDNADVEKAKEREDESKPDKGTTSGQETSNAALDFTKVPTTLDGQFEKLDADNALKPTILNVGEEWKLKQSMSLRGKAKERELSGDDQKDEKTKCFDLLDALSCSGSLAIDCATLHVVIAATHCFDETLIKTIIQKNVNPIERVERSLVIVAGTIHKREAVDIIAANHLPKIQAHSAMLTQSED